MFCIRHATSPPLTAALAALLLAGCAGMDSADDARSRAPLAHLGYSAAETLLEAPAWPGPATDRVIRIAPARMDAAFGPDAAERYGDALIRGILGAPDGPQVLPAAQTDVEAPSQPELALQEDASDEVAPEEADTRALSGHHWRLESRLDAPLGPISLSDRLIYPYTLNLALYRAGGETPWWQTQLEGALDGRGLSAALATDPEAGPASGPNPASAHDAGADIDSSAP